jgi:hypothetical protein
MPTRTAAATTPLSEVVTSMAVDIDDHVKPMIAIA